MRRGSISSELLMCGGGVRSILLLPLVTRCLEIIDVETELKCDLSGLSVNVGESMITQSSKVKDLGVIFDQFLNFILLLCVEAHIFILET